MVTRLHSSSVEGYYHHDINVVIKPGKTKSITINNQGYESCFEMQIGTRIRAYHLDGAYLVRSWQATGYGERFDIFYEYDRLYIESKTDEWLEFKSSLNCESFQRGD